MLKSWAGVVCASLYEVPRPCLDARAGLQVLAGRLFLQVLQNSRVRHKNLCSSRIPPSPSDGTQVAVHSDFSFCRCLLRDRRIIDRYGLTHLGRSGTPPLVGINIGTFCVEQSVVRGKCSSEWTEPSSATGVLGIPFCVCLGRGTMPLV